MQVKLKLAVGEKETKEILVAKDKFLIGRSEKCQLRPKSESVSRMHCVIVVRDKQVLVQDLKSRNGTFLNDSRLPSDRAKRLQNGDILKVGKLTFEVVVEHGLAGTKKPEVRDVKDAAARTVEGRGDSRFEDVDITNWLDEADQLDRIRQARDPDTRQLRLEDLQQEISSDSGELSVGDGAADPTEQSGAEDEQQEKKSGRPPKGPPKKLPKDAFKKQTADSRSAAGDALKRFFTGR